MELYFFKKEASSRDFLSLAEALLASIKFQKSYPSFVTLDYISAFLLFLSSVAMNGKDAHGVF